MNIKPTIDYLDEFFGSRHRRYREMMQDVGGSRHPEPYKGRDQVVQSIRNIVLGIENLFADMSVPGGYATPALLLEQLEGFRAMAAKQAADLSALNEKQGGHWIDDVQYAHEMSFEVNEAITHALRLSGGAVAMPARDRLQKLVERLPAVARQLQQRRNESGKPRATLVISDEYDVQDLLHAVLRIEFDDIRAEEWSPSYAGASKRTDFLLWQEEIVIEVKKTRATLLQPLIADQLTVDVANYRNHPRAKHLMCIVWDTEHLLKNPAALKGDLEGANTGFVTVVVVQ